MLITLSFSLFLSSNFPRKHSGKSRVSGLASYRLGAGGTGLATNREKIRFVPRSPEYRDEWGHFPLY
jgi:hypothetical protein